VFTKYEFAIPENEIIWELWVFSDDRWFPILACGTDEDRAREDFAYQVALGRRVRLVKQVREVAAACAHTGKLQKTPLECRVGDYCLANSMSTKPYPRVIILEKPTQFTFVLKQVELAEEDRVAYGLRSKDRSGCPQHSVYLRIR